jgi:hypothetical protein
MVYYAKVKEVNKMRKEELLKGAIDIHFHTMPDVRERRYDDIEIARVAASYQAVGYESTILPTDGGQVENPEWPEMFGGYLLYLYERGFSKEQLDRMTKDNTAYILGI